MTDDEFWDDVSNTLGWNSQPDVEDGNDLDCIGIDSPHACPECGATTACGYDSEGRPMIHVVEEDD